MPFVIALVIASLAQSGAPQQLPVQTRNCLHGSTEAAADKQRRETALKLARAIIDAETAAKRSGRYVPVAQLPNLPESPSGFKMQLTTDGATYTFSAKDTLDVCGFTLFTDQDGFVYEAAPVNRPGIRLVIGS